MWHHKERNQRVLLEFGFKEYGWKYDDLKTI